MKLDSGELNPAMVDFAAHHGFAIKTCRVRRPRTKGKVERMVDYVKDNFLNGREFIDLSDLNAQGMNWLDTVANVRVHATTGHRPVDLLVSEKPSLPGTTPTTKLHFVFDAWSRMVTVKADSSGSPESTIASYTYDD